MDALRWSMKKYSIEEIDQLRSLIVKKLLLGSGFEDIEHGDVMVDMDQVERHLRTYMLNGTTVLEMQVYLEKMKR